MIAVQPLTGSARASLIAKMAPIAWMLSRDPEQLQILYSTALSFMRLEGMHRWADAVENGEIITCSTCQRAAIVSGFTAAGEPLCAGCFR